MPILPPRNLPYSHSESSTKESPHTPNSIKGRAASQSANTTPSKTRDGAENGTGVLPRQEESTYHRKLRNLLWDFRRAYEKWIDLVSLQGAKAIASTSRLAASLDELLAKEAKESPRDIKMLDIKERKRRGKRMEEIAEIVRDLDAAQEETKDVISKVTSASMKFAALSEASESLLVDATQAKGSGFTFEKEMWVSWCMDKFVWALQVVASQCIIQTSHLQYLAGVLIKEGCAPGAPPISHLIEEENRQSRKDAEEEEEVPDSEEEEGDKYINKQKRKGRRRLRQKVLEEWQDLAILYNESSRMNAELFEDICEVEVGRWEER